MKGSVTASNKFAAWMISGAIVLGGTYFYQVYQQREDAKRDSVRATCQSQYNVAFATQLTERSRLAAASDDAKNELLGGISKLILAPQTTDPKVQAKRAADFQKLFRTFDKAVEQVEKDRAATPLPTIPNC